jgi:hypothetical protein
VHVLRECVARIADAGVCHGHRERGLRLHVLVDPRRPQYLLELRERRGPAGFDAARRDDLQQVVDALGAGRGVRGDVGRDRFLDGFVVAARGGLIRDVPKLRRVLGPVDLEWLDDGRSRVVAALANDLIDLDQRVVAGVALERAARERRQALHAGVRIARCARREVVAHGLHVVERQEADVAAGRDRLAGRRLGVVGGDLLEVGDHFAVDLGTCRRVGFRSGALPRRRRLARSRRRVLGGVTATGKE